MNLGKISNTLCLLKSFSDDQMYPKSTQKISEYVWFYLFTGQIMKQSK